LDEECNDAFTSLEASHKRVKVHYDHSVKPHSFREGYLIIAYDNAKKKLGPGKF